MGHAGCVPLRSGKTGSELVVVVMERDFQNLAGASGKPKSIRRDEKVSVGTKGHGGGKRETVNHDGLLAVFGEFEDATETWRRAGLANRVFEDEEVVVFIEGEAQNRVEPGGESDVALRGRYVGDAMNGAR